MNIDIKLHKEDLPDDLKLSDNIAIDCEFMGLNVERDALCLVQISTGKNDAHIIQLNRENYNAPNLKNILTDEKICKIFHYARADLLFIKKYLKVNVENINCTKLMSKLARSYSDKHGLKDLVREFTGKDISKNLQSSDFGTCWPGSALCTGSCFGPSSTWWKRVEEPAASIGEMAKTPIRHGWSPLRRLAILI